MGYFCLVLPSTPHVKPMTTVEIQSLVEDCISKHGVHLVALEVKGEGKGKSVEVYIDSEKGVTTEICSTVSREVDRLVESAGIVRDSYRLTVSSPGIARPLKYAWQYGKHVGRQLEVKARSGEGLRSYAGKLESVSDRMIVLASGKNGEPETIAFDVIVEARVRAPW